MSNELAAASPPSRFFTRVDWAAFWTALITSFLVYFYTMAPTVTLEDSGELAVAGDHLGVPHPPGYPIWTMICWIFRHIFAFVPYRGYPNPAWAITLVSVVFGALAIAVTAMLISRSGADLLDCVDRDRNATLWRAALYCTTTPKYHTTSGNCHSCPDQQIITS